MRKDVMTLWLVTETHVKYRAVLFAKRLIALFIMVHY